MIEFLAEQLGIPTSNARILYDQWLENAMNTLSDEKPLVIAGLGTFTFENNEIRFKADESLELDVNRSYAGLEPLPEEKLGPAKFTETDFEDPFMEIIAPKYLELNREPKPVSEPIHVPVPEPAPVEEEVVAEVELEPEPETIKEPVEKAPLNLVPWIYAAVILVVLAVGGYFGIEAYEGWMESKMPKAISTTTIPTEAPPVADAPMAAEAGVSYGLVGTPATLEGRVYGIIVHSLPVKEDSEAQCAKISPLGFRCSVIIAERNGLTTYRVAIGQFQTNESALEAVAQLPSEYQKPGNFFIARIQ